MNKWILKTSSELSFGELKLSFEKNFVLLIGLGKSQTSFYRLRKLIHKAVHFLQNQNAEITQYNFPQNDNFIQIALSEANYSFDQFKTKKENSLKLPFEQNSLLVKNIQAAKNLINSPPNIVTPEYLANYAMQMANEKIKTKILNQEECQELGMGAFLAVAQGSSQRPYLIEMNYFGNKESKEQIGLIGKGLTYDTGGLCLKPNNYMNGMQSDMAGAATVMHIIKAASELDLKVNLTALVLACENGFSEKSYRPSDILTAFNGKTIEVIDTDAEGRLTLADAIAYLSQRENIKTIIDYATLTGSCVSALGEVAAGAFSNSPDLLKNFLLASEEVGEPIWELPLFEEYKEDLESSIADLAQCSGRPDASLAAIFLQEFLARPKEQKWLHLDIAGTAYLDKENEYFAKGATGRHIWSTINYLSKI